MTHRDSDTDLALLERGLMTRSIHLDLLARARAAIEHPAVLDSEMRHALLSDITATQGRLSIWPLPWPVEIHVGTIDHREGITTFAAVTRRALIQQMASFCREYWSEIDDERDPDSIDDETVVSDYSKLHHNDWCDTNIECLMPEPAIDSGTYAAGKILFLDCRHISPSTDDLLQEWTWASGIAAPLFALATPLGWLLPRMADCALEQLSDDLARAVTHATGAGADHLLIGRDGLIVESLPKFG